MKRAATNFGDDKDNDKDMDIDDNIKEIECGLCTIGPLQEWWVEEFPAHDDWPALTLIVCVPCQERYKKDREHPGHPCHKNKNNDKDKDKDMDKDQDKDKDNYKDKDTSIGLQILKGLRR